MLLMCELLCFQGVPASLLQLLLFLRILAGHTSDALLGLTG